MTYGESQTTSPALPAITYRVNSSQGGKKVSSLERDCSEIARSMDSFRHNRAAVDRVKTTPRSVAYGNSLDGLIYSLGTDAKR